MTKILFLITLIWAVPTWGQKYGVMIDEGAAMAAAEAAALEARLSQNPEDLTARARLIGYYQNHPSVSSGESRLRQVSWLIEHHPDSAILHQSAAKPSREDVNQSGAFTWRPLSAAWQRQVDAHPDNLRVLANALDGTIVLDRALYLSFLQRFRRMEPTNPAWPSLLGTSYAIALVTGFPSGVSGPAKEELLESTDLALTGITGHAILALAKRRAAAEEISTLGQTLLDRAKAWDPDNPHWSGTAPSEWTERDLWRGGVVPAMAVPPGAVRVAREVQSGRLLEHEGARCIRARCPKEKTFRLQAVIGGDGRVKALHANAGDGSLIAAAMEAARFWSFSPTRVGGRPVAVVTEIDVEMTPIQVFMPPTITGAGPDQPRTAIDGAPYSGGVFRVGGGVSQPEVIHKVDPGYSTEARDAKISGSVLLQLVVDVDGKPKNIKVVKGIGMGLDEKAIEAVQQWVFRPAMKGDAPVPVFATVNISFRLLERPPAPPAAPQ